MTYNLIDSFIEAKNVSPDMIVVKDGEDTITYRQLDKQISLISTYLKEKGVRKGDRIALLLDRSFQTILFILGILKSGASYVPIDTRNPHDRIEYIIKDCSPKLVITSNELTCFVEEEHVESVKYFV